MSYPQQQSSVDRCSVCRKFKPIIKRERKSVSGSAMKFRPFLICADCDAANAEQYRQSQIRYVGEQIALIDQILTEHPDYAPNFTETRAAYVATLATLQAGVTQ